MSTLTIGNFDGVHLGHRALVARARALAGPTGKTAAVTFDPLPAVVLTGKPRPMLARLDERIAMLKDSGADDVIVLPCDRVLLSLGAESFIDALALRVPVATIVEGSDFRFGNGRAAGVQELAQIGKIRGFEVVTVDEVRVRLEDGADAPARSNSIRWLLAGGRVRDAARMLGRPYSISGQVVCGDKRGRTIGFPTMNIDGGPTLLPADGVYSGFATLPTGKRHPAAISVGTKPTFGELSRACEAHLLGYSGPLDDYGFRISVTFEAWIRPQAAFQGAEPLIAQMKRDVDRAGRELMEVTR